MGSQTELPLVSVVIPCFNTRRFVADAIEAALGQTYGNVEVVVIDDGSTDGSWDVIASYGERIIAERTPNRGAQAARNRGFQLSSGDFVQFLDADDLIAPQKIARQVEVMRKRGFEVSYCDAVIYDVSSGHCEPVPGLRDSDDIVRDFLKNSKYNATASYLYARRVVALNGGWDPRIVYLQDYLFNMSIAIRGIRMVYVPEVLVTWRHHDAPSVRLTAYRSKALAIKGLESKQRVYETARELLLGHRPGAWRYQWIVAKKLWRVRLLRQRLKYVRNFESAADELKPWELRVIGRI